MRYFILLVIASVTIAACSEEPSQPVEPPVNAPEPLDTTSHDFIWEFDTVGIQYSSIEGVAAVGPKNVWVAGKFYRYDSTGKPDPVAIGNAAHWDGVKWTYHGFNVLGIESWYHLADAAAFGADNIWICGGSPFRWDGAQWKAYGYDGFYFGSGINAIWSTPDQKHVCAVGYKKSCVLYSAEDDEFHWVNMPREEHLYDVTGTDDGTMYIASGDPEYGGGHVYTISPEGEVETLLRCPYGPVYNVWLSRDTLFLSCRKGIYRKIDRMYDPLWPEMTARETIYDVDAEAPNNIIATTDQNFLLHYNGSTWEEIHIPYPKMLSPYDISVAGKHVFIAAYTPEQYCLVIHGTRL